MDCQGCWETFMSNPQEVCEIICGSDYGMADVSPELTALTKNYGNLTPMQAEQLDEALHTLIDNSPIYRVMYNYLLQKGFQIAWRYGANPGAGGGYNPNDRSISLGDFTSEYLSEELIHAFQDAYYGGTVMKDIANDPTGRGRSNIEFEAQLLQDIVMRTQKHYRENVDMGKDYISMFGGRETYAFFLVSEDYPLEYEKYGDYIDYISIRNYGVNEIYVTPKNMNDLGNAKYFEILEVYRFVHRNDRYGSPSISGFQPNAMLHLFNLASPFNYRQSSK
jgi:hypothetical protein